MSVACRGARGFTLLEAMIAGVLLVFVGGSMLLVSLTGRDLLIVTDASLASQTSARAGLGKLTAELRQGSRSGLQQPSSGPLPVCPSMPIPVQRGCPDELPTSAGEAWRLSTFIDLPPNTPGKFECDRLVRYRFLPPDETTPGRLERRLFRRQGGGFAGEGEWVTLVAGVTDATVFACNPATGLVDLSVTTEQATLRGPQRHTLRSRVFLRNP
jgi:hypothetical protein